MRKVSMKNKPKRDITCRHWLVRDLAKNWQLYLIFLPILAYFLIFRYKPMIGIIMAFEKYQPHKGLWGSEFVGLKWFKEFFGSYYFVRLLSNTLLISLKDILVGFPAPILFALLLNEVRWPRFKKVVQTISYMPYFVSMVVISSLIISFFSSTGAVTQLFEWFGMPKTNMLGSNQYFQGIFVSTNLWQMCGFNSIIYLAAISTIDQALYEAAVIDGANRWKQTLHVTLPGIATTIIMLFIIRLGSVLNVSFEKIILLYSPATYETGDVISSFVYRKGIQEANYSYSTAVNLFNSVISFALLLTFNGLSKRYTENSLF
jgi:putative aldouronate transport system permease protein